MKKLTIKTALATAACGLLISATPAQADHDRDREAVWAYAKVVDVDPIYREVRVREPRQVCEEVPVVERTHYRGGTDPGRVLVGAVIGGVIGHQFGSGGGNTAAAIVGAVGGAYVGNQIQRAHERDRYRLTVRLDSGARIDLTEVGEGELRVGDRVRVVDNRVYRD